MATLATVQNGRIISHYEGDANTIVYNSNTEISIVEMTDSTHVQLRNNNLQNKTANTILEWNYNTKQFDVVAVQPNVNEYWKSALHAVRQIRQKVLVATDWIEMGNASFIPANTKNDIITYRQNLRDMTKQQMLVDANAMTQSWNTTKTLPMTMDLFPTPPAYIANTVITITSEVYTFTEDEMASFN